MEIFTSNTETHVEYTFEVPTPLEKELESDCEVMDYYPSTPIIPQNTVPSDLGQSAETAAIADIPDHVEPDTISIHSGPCERLSDGFEDYCEKYLNKSSDMDQVNQTSHSSTENAVTTINDTLPVNVPSDNSGGTVSLNLSVKLSDWDLSLSEMSMSNVNTGKTPGMEPESASEVMNINRTSNNNMATDTDHGNPVNSPSDTSNDNFSDSDEYQFPSETSVSHTETDCSMNENIIRVRNEIVVELTNRTCHLVLPKLTDKTINYWKSSNAVNNAVKLTPWNIYNIDLDHDIEQPNNLPATVITGTMDESNGSAVKPERNELNKPSDMSDHSSPEHTASSGYNTPENLASSGHNTLKIEESASLHVKASTGSNNTPKPPAEISDHTEDSETGSLSESLLKPVSTRPKRENLSEEIH